MLTTEIELCKMETEDVGEAVSIEQEVFSQPWSAQGFLDALKQDTLFVVARQKQKTVAYCGMYCSFEEGEITNVAVKPGMDNQGIGRKMVGYLLQLALEKKISRVVLEVRRSNSNAIHLYESLGFQMMSVRKGLYEKPKEDGYIMILNRSLSGK